MLVALFLLVLSEGSSLPDVFVLDQCAPNSTSCSWNENWNLCTILGGLPWNTGRFCAFNTTREFTVLDQCGWQEGSCSYDNDWDYCISNNGIAYGDGRFCFVWLTVTMLDQCYNQYSCSYTFPWNVCSQFNGEPVSGSLGRFCIVDGTVKVFDQCMDGLTPCSYSSPWDVCTLYNGAPWSNGRYCAVRDTIPNTGSHLYQFTNLTILELSLIVVSVLFIVWEIYWRFSDITNNKGNS